MRLLVTGGAGFIGSEFVRMTIAAHPDDQITVLDKLTYAGNLDNLKAVAGDDRYRFVHGDICDVELAKRLAAETDVVVNFAAETHVDRSLLATGDFVQTNVSGALTLLEAARVARHERFVQVSTDEVYGEVTEGWSDEGDRLRPRSPYAASKAAAEMLVEAYRTSYGVPVIITRGCNTYGPYQYPEKIIPLFITNAIDDEPLPVYGHGGAVRDYLHVSDHARAIDTALRCGIPGEDYNVGCGNQITGLEVARAVLDTLGKPHSLKAFVEDRPGHDQRYAVDSAKLRALGWRHEIDFAAGIAQSARWYADNEQWWRPLKGAAFQEFYRRNYRPVAAAAP